MREFCIKVHFFWHSRNGRPKRSYKNGGVRPGYSITLIVSADPAQWLAAHAAELRVRASETLPMDGGELLDPADVETIVNPDGTVSLVVSRPVGEPNRFYRVELTQ